MRFLIFSLLLFSMLISCDKEDDLASPQFIAPTTCTDGIFIGADFFNSAPSDEFFFVDASIEGDCLVGSLQYGGGCAEVDFLLVVFNPIATEPAIFEARISLDDDDTCEALILYEFSYELKGLQVGESDKIALRLQGIDEVLMYNY